MMRSTTLSRSALPRSGTSISVWSGGWRRAGASGDGSATHASQRRQRCQRASPSSRARTRILRAQLGGVGADQLVAAEAACDQLPVDLVPGTVGLRAGGALHRAYGTHAQRMFTARATTSPIVTSAASAWVGHQRLRERRQGHRVGGAERGGVGERDVEVVDHPRLPALAARGRGRVICGNRKSGVVVCPVRRASGPPWSSSQYHSPNSRTLVTHSAIPEKISGRPFPTVVVQEVVDEEHQRDDVGRAHDPDQRQRQLAAHRRVAQPGIRLSRHQADEQHSLERRQQPAGTDRELVGQHQVRGGSRPGPRTGAPSRAGAGRARRSAPAWRAWAGGCLVPVDMRRARSSHASPMAPLRRPGAAGRRGASPTPAPRAAAARSDSPAPADSPARAARRPGPAVSTPSAITSSDSARAMAMMASVIARVATVGAQAVDERAIDLDRVERQAGQVGERRVAHAEVVEHEADAERFERVEGVVERVEVTQHRALGDLEAEADRVQAAGLERAQHELGQLAAARSGAPRG